MTSKIFSIQFPGILGSAGLQASFPGSLDRLSDDCCSNGRIATFIINLGDALKASSLEECLVLAPVPEQRGLYGCRGAWAVPNTRVEKTLPANMNFSIQSHFFRSLL